MNKLNKSSQLHRLLMISLVLVIILSSHLGAVKTVYSDWFAIMSEDTLSGSAFILWNIRLPRVLFAGVIGACLGLAGALTQGLFRNPLADPGLLGVSSGAACAVALSIVLMSSLKLSMPPQLTYWIIPIAAFLGGVGICFTLDKMASWLTGGSIAGLLLTGIALNALAGSVIGLCTYLANDEQLRSLSFWTLGSLSTASWPLVLTGAVLLCMARLAIRRLLNTMNALALGEQVAGHIGVNVKHLRRDVIIIVAFITGFSVAWSGLIGFIGLVAPHLVRTMLGPDQRHVAPLSMLVGALLLIVADTLARLVAIPADIPVGIFTSIIGAPFFLFLLLQSRRRV